MVLLVGLYFGLMAWAEGFIVARALFLSDPKLIFPIVLAFGIQAALFAVLRFQLFVPSTASIHSGALLGASGTTSTVAMLACCIHHVADLLPILGLTAASFFMLRFRYEFLWVSLAMSLLGITIMLITLFRARRKSLAMLSEHYQAMEIE